MDNSEKERLKGCCDEQRLLLRRELIEAHLLTRLRDGSKYWKEQASL